MSLLKSKIGLGLGVLGLLVLSACSSPAATSESSAASAAPASSAAAASASAAPEASASAMPASESPAAADSPMGQTLAYLNGGEAPKPGMKIAYLTECVNNPYCDARLKGVKAAAKQYGMDVKVFDANFNPNDQLKMVQDAIQQGFDGYVFSPVADAPGCSAFKLLMATGKPVATANSPMCGNADFTEGAVGFVGMQTESFFQQHVENAFASCQGECEAMAVGGYVGSDLFTRWENAIKAASAKYPNVKVVVDQPGDFDPGKALQVTQDALRAHPNLSIVVSSWDDMTRGVEQGVTSSGKTPGKDVNIFSVGATKDGVDRVTKGTWNETSILLPYEESFYPVVQLAKKFVTGEDTPGFTNLAEAPVVVDGPGDIFITADNASTFTPEY